MKHKCHMSVHVGETFHISCCVHFGLGVAVFISKKSPVLLRNLTPDILVRGSYCLCCIPSSIRRSIFCSIINLSLSDLLGLCPFLYCQTHFRQYFCIKEGSLYITLTFADLDLSSNIYPCIPIHLPFLVTSLAKLTLYEICCFLSCILRGSCSTWPLNVANVALCLAHGCAERRVSTHEKNLHTRTDSATLV